jgi:peptide-methionine (S)-S-oxide reductase
MMMNNSTIESEYEELETATLGGGCFWCLEPIFEALKGVERVESGYAGGSTPNPTYQQVCTENTGHAEVIQITFHPEEISFEDILRIFFEVHDPTTLNRQGADVGTQYRSIILYHSEEQKHTAERVVREIEEAKLWKDPIVTEIQPLKTFYRAEAYHQEYFENNPNQPYCRMVIAPKVEKFKNSHSSELKQ